MGRIKGWNVQIKPGTFTAELSQCSSLPNSCQPLFPAEWRLHIFCLQLREKIVGEGPAPFIRTWLQGLHYQEGLGSNYTDCLPEITKCATLLLSWFQLLWAYLKNHKLPHPIRRRQWQGKLNMRGNGQFSAVIIQTGLMLWCMLRRSVLGEMERSILSDRVNLIGLIQLKFVYHSEVLHKRGVLFWSCSSAIWYCLQERLIKRTEGCRIHSRY